MASQVDLRSCTWRDVPGYFDFADLYSQAVVKAPDRGARFVEMGILFGRSTMFMADAIRASGKQIAFDAIDCCVLGWNGWQEDFLRLASKMPEEHAAVARLAIGSSQTVQGVVAFFLKHAGLDSYANIRNRKAQVFASHYQDESLDFVFVDTSHTYEDTRGIISMYLPKVKKGGVLAGHDYSSAYPGVVKAVGELLGSVEIVGRSWVHNKSTT